MSARRRDSDWNRSNLKQQIGNVARPTQPSPHLSSRGRFHRSSRSPVLRLAAGTFLSPAASNATAAVSLVARYWANLPGHVRSVMP